MVAGSEAFGRLNPCLAARALPDRTLLHKTMLPNYGQRFTQANKESLPNQQQTTNERL